MISERLKLKLNTLNENQLKAVVHLDKPLFVVAGAGTGKTNTLTSKIAYLIEEINVNPEHILALTFTNKAAREIRNRVNEIINPKQTGSWLYTFHAFALRVLRSHAIDLKLGYSNDFTVIDEEDARKVIKEILDKYANTLEENYTTRQMKNIISNHKSKILKIDNSEEMMIYREYQNNLIKDNLMDFDDLIVNLHRLLTTNQEILLKYQMLFKYILVDEFQDTDILQYQIIKALNVLNTFVVGDPDQSIYGFRGARYENNENFIKDFNAEVIVLDINYRSTNNILKVANKVIKNNDDRTTEKDLRSDLGNGSEVIVKELYNDHQEVEFVVSEIMRLMQLGYEWRDFAILYRNNSLSRLFEHSFTKFNMPYVVYGGLSFYERKEVKDILAYLHVILNDQSDFYLKRIVNVPSRKLGKVTINKLEEYALLNNLSMFEAIDDINTLNGPTKERLLQFKTLILTLREEVKELTNLIEVVDVIYYGVEYNEVLKSESKEDATERRANIFELKNVFYESNYVDEDNNLSKVKKVLDDLALMTSLDLKPKEEAIKISTIHQVKGLEFKVVFMVSLEEEIFPNFRTTFDKDKLNEERRLFYVGITRAKEYLYLSYATQRFVFGQLKMQLPSVFIIEVQKGPKTSDDNKQLGNYKTGDLVEHQVFGRGIIITTLGDILQIAFNHEHGIKKISTSFKGMKKVIRDEEI